MSTPPSPPRRILHLALHDLRLTARDRAAFFWMLLFPIALMWLFGGIGGGASGSPRVGLGVEDRDGGWLARAFVAELDDEQVRLREVGAADEDRTEEAEEPLPPRVLVIPEGFTEKVLGGESQTLRLELGDGADEEFTFAARVVVARAIVRTLGRLVEMAVGGEGLEGEAARGRFERLAARPPGVRLEVSTAGRGRPVPRGRALSVPGTLTMIVLMMTLIYGGVFLVQEKQQGMLRRQASAPLTRGHIFLGKLLGRMLVAGLQIALLVGVGRLLFGISWGGSPAGLVLVLATYAFAVAGLSVLLGALFHTPEQVSTVAWISSLVMASLGGCWWPAEIMPAWLRNAAHLFPTAWAMDAFHALISFGRGLDAVLLPAAVLLAFGLLTAALGARFLRYD